MSPKHTNLDKLKEMYAKSKSGFTTQFWYPKGDETIIRILPPPEDREVFYKETGSHKFGDSFFWCPRLTKGEKCPVCEERRRRYEAGTEADMQIAVKLKAKRKFIYNIVDRKAEDPTEVHLYSSGLKVWEKILSYYFDPDYGALDDVEKGYDFKIMKKMQGEYANYDDSRPVKKSSKLADTDEEVAEILSKMKDPDFVVVLKDYNTMKAALDQFIAEFYGEQQSTNRPAVEEIKTKPKASKPQSTPVLEDDDGDEEPGDIDEFEQRLMKELESGKDEK